MKIEKMKRTTETDKRIERQRQKKEYRKLKIIEDQKNKNMLIWKTFSGDLNMVAFICSYQKYVSNLFAS